ncbi:hypothetical protein [Saccharopolyspora gloriosae]|uniref:hypothetical protein n=1 Tax=Saccharopolyspora gloriosae TaxID=455344 RepID=UPI001FB601C9|nr:hypothetical protein [Saccharopolyspora gloriosae]
MGIEADPQVLQQVTTTLRNAESDLDTGAAPPPVPQAGDITELLAATLSLLCEGVGNVAASAGGLGQAVAEGRADYETIDYDQALNLKRTQTGG